MVVIYNRGPSVVWWGATESLSFTPLSNGLPIAAGQTASVEYQGSISAGVETGGSASVINYMVFSHAPKIPKPQGYLPNQLNEFESSWSDRRDDLPEDSDVGANDDIKDEIHERHEAWKQ
jgi:hypothetical protein